MGCFSCGVHWLHRNRLFILLVSLWHIRPNDGDRVRMMMTHIPDCPRCLLKSALASRANFLICLTVFVSMAFGAQRMMQSLLPFLQISYFLRPSSLTALGSVIVQTCGNTHTKLKESFLYYMNANLPVVPFTWGRVDVHGIEEVPPSAKATYDAANSTSTRKDWAGKSCWRTAVAKTAEERQEQERSQVGHQLRHSC